MPSRSARRSLLVCAALVAGAAVSGLRADEPDLLIRTSYNISFGWTQQGEKKVLEAQLLAAVRLQNVSGRNLEKLTISGAPPEGFILEPPPAELHRGHRAYVGYEEEFSADSFTIRQPNLRRSDQVSSGRFWFFLKLRPAKQPFFRPSAVDRFIPATRLTVEYTVNGEAQRFEANLEQQPLEPYGGLSTVTMDSFLGMFATVTLKLDAARSGLEWTLYPAANGEELGLVGVSGGRSRRGHYRLQAWSDHESSLPVSREIAVEWRAAGATPLDAAAARSRLKDVMAIVGNLDVEAEEPAETRRIGALRDVVLLRGRWIDRGNPTRPLSGPFVYAAVRDPASDQEVYLYAHGQVQPADRSGPPPAAADIAAREEALVLELDGYLKTLKVQATR